MKNDCRGKKRSTAERWTLHGVGLGLVFVVGLLVLSGQASGSFKGDGLHPPLSGEGWSPGHNEPLPPKAPWAAQECMDDFLRNEQRCKDIWCEPASFLWFTWTSCDDSELQDCTDRAKATFDCCISGRSPC